MTVSPVSICNMALSAIGHDFITAIDEDTKPGRLCNLHYPICRDAVLRAHAWNFATKRTTLAASATAPNHEYSYAFPLPTDFLKMIRTADEAESLDDDYRLEAGNLLSNGDTVSIEYIYRCEDTNQFDPLFVTALAQRLAAEICVPLTDNANMTANLWQVYQDKLREARGVDGQEGVQRNLDSDVWLRARA